MNWLTKIFHRGEEIDREIDEELRFHIETRIERYIQTGMTPEQARRKALDRFGNFEQIRQAVREIDLGTIESVWQDVRYAARTLAKSPGFTATALLSLALGIGLNTAIFSAINAVLLRPLPYKDPERIVYIGQTADGERIPSGINPVNFLEWEKQNHVFDAMAAVFPFHHNFGRYVLITGGEPVPIKSLRVGAKFFDVVGVQPTLGRGFLPEEDKPGTRAVVLSHRLWRRQFASDPAVVGRDIMLDDAGYRVVGVMPRGFRYLNLSTQRGDVDLWLSNPFDAIPRTNLESYGFRPIARLKPGISINEARAEMQVISRSLEREYPKENKGITLAAVPLLEAWAGQDRPHLVLLLGAVGLVLLIACANVANLLMARAGARKQEFAMRAALGAGRPRLVRQLLTESLLLGFAAGTAGLILALGSSSLLKKFFPDLYRLDEASIDPQVLGFTLLISALTSVVFGLVPAMTSSKVDIVDALKGAGRNTYNQVGSRIRKALVVVQVALSLVLLSACGLMINSLWRLYDLKLGFDAENLLTVQMVASPVDPLVKDLGFKYESPGSSDKRRYYAPTAAATRFAERMVERFEKLPGVKSAAAADFSLPFVRGLNSSFRKEGQVSLSPEEERKQLIFLSAVTPAYFRTMEIRLIQGRAFDLRDGENAPGVAIISQSTAREFGGQGQSVIGQRIRIDSPEQPFEIVGISADVRMWPNEESFAHAYIPESQSWDASYSELALGARLQFQFVLRAQSESGALGAAVRNAVRELNPQQPVDEILTMKEVLANDFGPWRSSMVLFGFFAALAVLLSAIGIYGLVSYSVAQRTHEIGIRMAMGAGRGDVLRLVMKNGLLLAAVGIVLGSGAAYWLTRLIANQLYGVTPTDPVTFASVALALLAVALLACYLPARRAASLDPMAALRCCE